MAALSQGEHEYELRRLLARRDRSTMLGHLLWQHWRQSWRLIVIMAGLYIGLSILVCFSDMWQEFFKADPLMRGRGFDRGSAITVPLALMATLIGACVFLSDQERRNYRFFAEHNIPPRYVWLTRQVCWGIAIAISTLVICYFWLRLHSNIAGLWEIIKIALQQGWYNYENSNRNYSYLPPVHVGLAFVAIGYAVGQWMSQLIRSGILAGFFALLLSTVLCGWVLLMHTMQMSFWWTVLPIPQVLLWATWLRAPDWISENERWSARGKAAAAVLVPALALMIAVPMYRVHEVPVESPGFDVPEYEAQIKAKLEAGLATAKMYEDAYKAFRGLELDLSSFGPSAEQLNLSQELAVAAHRTEIEAELKRASENNLDRPNLRDLADRYLGEIGGASTEVEKKWLDDNAYTLELLMKAAQQPNCIFYDPASAKHFAGVMGDHIFDPLLLTSGRQLQAEGKLDEALDRYLAALRVISDIYSSRLFYMSPLMLEDVRSIFLQIAHWAGQKGQTPERLRAAIGRLQATEVGTLRMEELVKNNYILTRRLVLGDSDLRQFYYPSNYPQLMEREVLWSTLMPWENDRALRVLV